MNIPSKDTITVVTLAEGTLTWELPAGATFPSLQVKTGSEKLLQQVMRLLMPAVVTSQEIAIPLIENALQVVHGMQLDQIMDSLRAQVFKSESE